MGLLPGGTRPCASTPIASATCRQIVASWLGVMREGVAVSRFLDMVATRCDAAQQGLLQPFPAFGVIGTAKSGMIKPESSVSGEMGTPIVHLCASTTLL